MWPADMWGQPIHVIRALSSPLEGPQPMQTAAHPPADAGGLPGLARTAFDKVLSGG